MGVETSRYKCTGCGWEAELSEGGSFMSSRAYFIFKCPDCGNVESLGLEPEEDNLPHHCSKCNAVMTPWNHKCPKCGLPASITMLYRDH